MGSVQASWNQIESWLVPNVPSLAGSLPSGVSTEAISAVESEIALAFPDDLRESYLTHNGAEYGEGELDLLPSYPDAFDQAGFCLLPVDRIASEWKVWKELIDGGDFEGETSEPDSGIDNAWWSDGWIPVGGNGGGDFICVDVKPTAEGTVGQVIYAPHDMEERKLLAASWGDYLQTIAEGIENGTLAYDDESGLIHKA